MALFQKPAETPEEVEASRPLEIPPAEVAEMDEQTWYRRAYRGENAPQLTVRAVVMGSLLGFLLAFTNLYVGLKAGWTLGIAITACILSYAIWTSLQKMGLAKTPMSILENNCMQATASSAGAATGGTMVSAMAALLMLSATPENPAGQHLPWPVLAGWTALLALLGTVLAIPMKRNLINHERLRFPSGTAAAVTLQSLYASGAAAAKQARSMMVAAAAGAVVPLLIDLNIVKTVSTDAEGKTSTVREPLVAGTRNLLDWLPARGTHVVDGKEVPLKPSDWTLVWDMNPVMVAAGAIVGLRTAIWMTVGGLLLAYVVGPLGMETAWVNTNGTTVNAVTKAGRAWKEVGLWVGAPMLVSAGLLSFAFQWRTIVSAFSGIIGDKAASDARIDATEVPMSWFIGGVTVSGVGIILISAAYFDVPLIYGVLAVFLTLALSLVAARATGETDITPTGAMGKIMQLTYGVLIPQSVTANLMTAGITAGAAGSCADLLNDLKSGYLLGANPRRQFIAQAAGIVSGTIATVAGFYLLVPDATALTGTDTAPPDFPAPAAQSWKAVAEVFRMGIQNMHPMHQQAIAVGLGVGAALLILEKLIPAARRWLPSATGIGFGFILPFQYPLSMLVGALIAYAWTRADERHAGDYLVPVASGVIAGVSILGVLVAAINNFALSG